LILASFCNMASSALSIASTGKASIASQKCWLSIFEKFVRNKYSRLNVGKKIPSFPSLKGISEF
ncbi:MAG TPA: hypothetical protein PKK29_05910, partial [Acetivibrio saccincola]|nr:hypothetical protein [Acetivibrio saccincola]